MQYYEEYTNRSILVANIATSIGVKDAIAEAKTLAIFTLFNLDERSSKGEAVAGWAKVKISTSVANISKYIPILVSLIESIKRSINDNSE